MLSESAPESAQHDSEAFPFSASPRSQSVELLVDADGSSPLRRMTDDADEPIKIALQVDHRTGSPRRSMPPPARKHVFPFNLISPKRRKSAASPELSSLDRATSDSIEYSSRDLSPERSTSNSAQDRLGDASVKTPLSQHFNRQDNRYSLPSDFGSLDADATLPKGPTAHRQARMIDGALFQGKTRKGRLIRESTPNGTLSPEYAIQVCFHSHQEPRASWLHAILNRLQGKQRRKHADPELRKQHSSLGDCGLIGQSSRDFNEYCQEVTAVPSLPQMNKAPVAFTMGLDGSWDEEHNNKPLPLSPLEQSARPSLQSETERYIFQQSPEIAIFDFRKSFASPGLVKNRQRDELRSLVSATMSGPQELSPKEKALKYRYSAESSQSPPVS